MNSKSTAKGNCYEHKTSSLFSLLLTAYSILFFVNLNAEIRYVSKTGSSTPPYASWETAADSIQKAINICKNGDTVIVANGVYYENLIIDSAITLIGSSMDSTVIDGRGLGDYTITFNSNGSIENFRIYGRGESYPCRVIQSSTLHNVLIVRNCKISDAGVGIETGADIIAENLFMIYLTRGINLFGESNNYVTDCVVIIDNESSKGITIGFAPNGNYYITNNILLFTGTAETRTGISVGAVNKIYINNNLISGFGAIFFDIVTDTAFVKNNVLTGVAGITSSGNRVFVNNVILSKNYHGLQQLGGGWIISDYNVFWQNYIEDLRGLSYGDSDRVSDPMFVKDTLPNPEMDFDYHLQAYSPGIDKGDPNVLDPDGSRSDIGLFGGPLGESYTYQDLAPKPPRNLTAVVDSNQIFLKWNRNTEADTSYYKIYRDTTINFSIDSTKLISSQSDTFFVQAKSEGIEKLVYKIIAVDNQGNESLPSEELVIKITSVTINDYPMTINDYYLYQNYPNPFNPTTKIGYKLKERGYVKMMVYDIKGELVTVLVNNEQETGYYEIEFNVKSQKSKVKNELASGIYLYRIEVIGEGNIPVYSDMKKMILLK
jgi:hypothetical protein